MNGKAPTPVFFLHVVRAICLLVPAQNRCEWRQEWEAELIVRWHLLDRWERLNSRTRLDLLRRVAGALTDVLWFQQGRTRLLLVILNMLVAALTALGAGQELIVRGIFARETQPLLLSLAGIIVSLLFLTSAIAMWRRWSAVRCLVIATGAFSILLHVYGAMPPHRNMGYVALVVGAGYGLLMLLLFEWNRRRSFVL